MEAPIFKFIFSDRNLLFMAKKFQIRCNCLALIEHKIPNNGMIEPGEYSYEGGACCRIWSPTPLS